MRRLPEKDPTLIQVLSLYLLLLAFFVLLFNASQYDRGKAAAVKESLSSTFRTHGVAADRDIVRSTDQGDIPGAELVLDSFADLIRTELKVAKVENLQRGKLLRVTLDPEDLFETSSPGIRSDRDQFVNKLAELLGKTPPGMRHKVQVFMVGDWILPDQMKRDVPLPIARAAGLAEILLARGALAGTVSGGARHGAEKQISLIYRVDPETRPEDENPNKPAATGPKL
ncbi:MAG: hypothetical protein ACI9JL_000608 [Paracoccaceae bacterium]|jgi:hypothetical protein